MDNSTGSLASWATIAGTILSILGMIQSSTWLTAIGAVLFLVSVVALLDALRQRQILASAAIVVGGRSIDSLNIANLRRHLNRSLVIQEANHVVKIDGEDVVTSWQYAGYCRANRESAIQFSIDTDNNIPFDSLKCYAYDLRSDPRKQHRIRPMLLGPDGISKKVAVPFLEPLIAQQAFSVMLACALPGCMKGGVEYYTSTMSFDQDKVRRFTTRLLFRNGRPHWVRVYDCDDSGTVRLLNDLRPKREGHKLTEYLDVAQDVAAKSARIYVFQRARSLQQTDNPKPSRVA
jgi:hypothetical protein